MDMPRSARRVATLGGLVIAAAAFALVAWQRRWLTDDGMIFVRTARQIVAGHGPVYNTFERVEPCTSTLWPYLLALVAAVTGANVARIAVFLGGACAVLGVVIALDTATRWHRARAPGAVIAPAGVLVLVAAVPFADFATSGMESGLSTLWMAVIWRLLADLRSDAGTRRQLAIAVIYGLGPLIRPDFALVSLVFLVAAWRVLTPSLRRTLALLGAAAALAVAYEVFRAGYYGTLVPLPALTKSAARSDWMIGLHYLYDYARPYRMWLPAAVVIVLAVLLGRRLAPGDRLVAGTPIVAGLLELMYVLRVGGDFMHGRMMVPVTFLVLLPYLMLPVQRVTAPALIALAVWAALIGFGVDRSARLARVKLVSDEHWYYVKWTGREHPTDDEAFIFANPGTPERVAQALRTGQRRLLAESPYVDAPLAAGTPARVVVAAGHLGAVGAIVSLDDIAADIHGLASPIGARITATTPGDIGHEKRLPDAWILADVADPASQHDPAVTAARHALHCGAIAELLASVREPLTAGRFFDNLAGAVARTRLVIPSDPIEAERVFCGGASATP